MATRRGDQVALVAAAERARPVAPAHEQVLPLLPPLAPLLPGGALRRGAMVAAGGPAATSLVLALAAGPSAAGSWVGVVGLPSLGLAAADGLGLALERLLLVAAPPPREWATAVATLVDGVDVVVVRPPRSLPAGDARRLQARARQRGTVLLAAGPPGPFEADVSVATTLTRWTGLEEGAGHLRGRRVIVEATGRRAAARPQRVALWLPDAEGQIRLDDSGTVVALRGSA